MVRPTDQETTAIRKVTCHSQFPRGGGMLCVAAKGSTRVTPERKSEGKAWAGAIIVAFVGKEWERPQGTGTVPSCLVPGPRVYGVGDSGSTRKRN